MKALKVLILSPIVLLFISATRLILVANYNTTNALSLAAAGGVVGTLVGTVLPLLPPYLPVITLVFILGRKVGLASVSLALTLVVAPAYATVEAAYEETVTEGKNLIDEVATENWSAIATDYTTLLVLAGAGVVYAIWMALGVRRETALISMSAGIGKLVAGIVLAALVAAASVPAVNLYKFPMDFNTFSEVMRRPWVPAEEISLRSGGLKVGYTLATKDGWHHFLTEKDRVVEFFPAADIVSRKVCATRPDQYPLPLMALDGATSPALRPCPPG